MNIGEIFLKNDSLSNTLRLYYCDNKDKDRVNSFIENMGGETRIKNIVFNNIPDELIDNKLTRKHPKYIGIWPVNNKIKNWNIYFKNTQKYYDKDMIGCMAIERIKNFE